ncbi:MAG: tRNA pseudouridine(38-40) synthase TruA [Candidatus Dadabacteria bacterium]|nr:tRNA pseudouridine(38-40) synthase TruA [Candidatus Dadabacteria bacterium]
MRNIKLTIEYDGANYSGWQRQANAVNTVQREIERAIKKVTGGEATVHGSGRTDAGVHALGQVANFLTPSAMKTESIRKALNSELPEDITVRRAQEVAEDFHSRISAKKKTYFYRILNRPSRPAVERKTCWFISEELDFEAMKEACRRIPGEHDFKAFCNTNITVRTTVRRVFSAKLARKGGFIVFSVEANGFLKRMVRFLAGTLVRVGRGRLSPDGFERILKTGRKTRDVIPAPPRGLFLEKVLY